MTSAAPSAASVPAATLVDEIARVYEVGPRYAWTYLNRWAAPGSLPDGVALADLRRLEDVRALREPFPLWFDFAMSTNQRADAIASLLSPHLVAGASRFLDIGCGFGGLLIGYARAGFEVVGLEIDPERVALCEANCGDHGLTGCVHQADLLGTSETDDADLEARFGRFDAIAMIDVIEHVLDARRALERATALLAPSGVLLLEIPNREHPHFVAQDGHFGLYGITLLDRPRAIDLHGRFFDFAYDVGDYHPLTAYHETLAALGCGSAVIESPVHRAEPLAALPGLLAGLKERRASQAAAYARSGVAPELIAEIEQRVDAYLDELERERQLVASGAAATAAFRLRYLTRFWTLIARKRAI